jgi:hypothetical protein
LLKKKIITGIVILLVFAAAGASIWLAHKQLWGLKLNGEIKPIEVATLAFTVVIAILLQFYFLETADNDRAEKDLLIKNVNDALEKLRECRDTFQRTYESHSITSAEESSIKSQIRSLGHAIDALDVSLGKSECKHLQTNCQLMAAMLLRYKAALTGGDFPSKPYPSETYTDHQKIYREMDVALQELIFSINRH